MMDLAHERRLQEERRATRSAGSLGILPFVAYNKRLVQIEVPFKSGLDEQARPRFSAGAMVAFVMRADHDVIQREASPQHVVHPVQFPARLISAGKARLIGGHE